MRRKTIAKRLLDLDYEEEEEEGGEEDKEYFGVTTSLCLGKAKRRRHTHSVNGHGEVNGDTAPGPQINGDTLKLDHMVPETNRSTGEDPLDGVYTTESNGSLQTRSKAELVAMVLSMQKEMDSLREQMRCLTEVCSPPGDVSWWSLSGGGRRSRDTEHVASGKLASTLESLIERTELWSSSSHRRTTSPSMPLDSAVAILAPVEPVQWAKMEKSSYQQQQNGNCHHQQLPTETQNGEPHLPAPPLYQEFITVELLERCNTGTTAQKLTNDLLRGLYERDCLASHSISGVINSKRGQPKPALPAEEIQAILRAVQHYFPGKTDSEIKGYIRQKLQNEAKRLRKKPHLLTAKEEEEPHLLTAKEEEEPHLLPAKEEEPGAQGGETTAHT